jgi:hypothetical protein
MSNQNNSNYQETKDGWVKKDTSTTRGASPDWGRAERVSRWTAEIRKEREERNKAKPK